MEGRERSISETRSEELGMIQNSVLFTEKLECVLLGEALFVRL